MTPEALEALRVLNASIGRCQVNLAQRPGTDVAEVTREAHRASLALEWVAQFLNRDTEAKP